MISITDSSIWLRQGNNRARDEAALAFNQDRNIFLGTESKCPHCGVVKRTVDHLATRCDRMLSYDYTARHSEVVRYIHLAMCNRYKILRRKTLRTHSVQETVAGEEAVIVVDTRVKTDIKITHDRPDIVIHDKKRKEVIIIEIGIRSQKRLQTVETEKLHKYDLLAKELEQMYKCKSRIIPYVMTWEGIVTKHHRHYVEAQGLSPRIEAYIQPTFIKRTFESISIGYR